MQYLIYTAPCLSSGLSSVVNSLLKVLIAVVLSVSLLNVCNSFRSRCASNVRDSHCHKSSNVFSWLRNDKIGKRFSHTYLQVWMLVCRGSSHTWLVVLVVMIFHIVCNRSVGIKYMVQCALLHLSCLALSFNIIHS